MLYLETGVILSLNCVIFVPLKLEYGVESTNSGVEVLVKNNRMSSISIATDLGIFRRVSALIYNMQRKFGNNIKICLE